jgi:3-methylcrotonyl-CoA carboxylase alpha subunit
VSARYSYREGDRVRVVEVAREGDHGYRVLVDGAEITVAVESLGDGRMRLTSPQGTFLAEVTAGAGSDSDARFVRLGSMDFALEREISARPRARAHGGGLEAPMPGVVMRVMVAPGDEVKAGQPLVTLEAMKMEHVVRAPRAGRVRAIAARAGEMVNGGVPLVELEEGG